MNKRRLVVFLIMLLPALMFSKVNKVSPLLLKADNNMFPYEGTYNLKIENQDVSGRQSSFNGQLYKKNYSRQTLVWTFPKQNLNDVGMMVDDVIYYKPFKTTRATLMSYQSLFMNSGFSWGDVVKSMIAYDYSVESSSEKTEGGKKYMVLNLKPNKKGLYAKIVVWIEQSHFVYYKREYYSAMGDKIKEAIYTDYKWKNGKVLGYKVNMDNYDEELKSVAVISDIKDHKLPSFLFNPQNIGKIRARR